ncbi:YALIA101S06e00628g1_1 [Yarrowia lipolytica]|nr:YALIA101S06e00628g1_1 [Yarrowia lipolytica]
MSDDLRPYQLDRPANQTGRPQPLGPGDSPAVSPTNGTKPAGSKRNLIPATERSFLTVSNTIGASASSNMTFDVQRQTIAYTAGTGAVLGHYSTSLGLKQRYFCLRNTDQLNASFEAFQITATRDSYGFSSQTQYLGASEESPVDASPPKMPSPVKERAKSATAVAIRPDGRLLALGETGHSPKISIFSTAPDSDSSCPVAVITQHSFGVRFLRWSPCGTFLASLGTLNDGYLHIWHVQDKGVRLHSSNKCISQVEDMRWLSDKILITVGDHHVRVWKVEDKEGGLQNIQVLSGRNPVMGLVNNVTCTSVCPINQLEAVIGSKEGLVAVLNVSEETPKLTIRWQRLSPVSAVCMNSDGEICMAFGGKIAVVSLDEVLQEEGEDFGPIGTEVQQSPIVSLAEFGSRLVCLDSNRDISLIQDMKSQSIVQGQQGIIKGLTLGMSQVFWTADRVTCDDTSIKPELGKLNDESDNEISHALSLGSDVAIGDRSGRLSLYNEGSCKFSTQAHQADITGMAFHDGTLFTCSRDRTVQVFLVSHSSMELQQTIVGHTANILKLVVADQRLYSCSADRSIGVHALTGGVWAPLKSISLKSSPLDVILVDNELIVICSDKQVYVYRTDKCELVRNYKCANSRGDGLSVTRIVLGKFQHGGIKKDILVGVCTDKSLRLFDHATGALLASEWGHSDGVSGLILKPQSAVSAEVVTSGADGCLFVWKLSPWVESAVVSGSAALSTSPVARKVIPKLELSSIARENNLDTPNSPVLRPSPLRKSAVDSNGSPMTRTAGRPSFRSKETPSPVRNERPMSPARPKSPTRVSNVAIMGDKSPSRMGSSGSSRGISSGSPRAGNVSIDTMKTDLCVRLKRFRGEFDSKDDREKDYSALQEELEATLALLRGGTGLPKAETNLPSATCTTPAMDMETIVREFGDKIYSLLEDKMKGGGE